MTNTLPERHAGAAVPSFLPIDVAGRSIDLEYRWIGDAMPGAPVLVFLHEGLGSVAQWKTFPETLCQRIGVRGLVFSRYGYGASAARPEGERFPIDFMHRQAFDVLPQVLDKLCIDRPWLLGHSDGGSIALLHASRHSDRLRGIVVMAPHIFVEEVALASIRAARASYLTTNLRDKLARFHDDVDSAFFGWNDVWLDPAFGTFNIERECRQIRCPILAIQGEDDEYGTLEQIRGIARINPATRLLVLPQCGHAPQRDQPEMLIAAVSRFIMEGCRSRMTPMDATAPRQ